MVDIRVEGDQLVFEVRGWDKVWSLSSRLTIPASHIRSAGRDPGLEMGWFDSLKLMGTSVPELFRAGVFLQKGEIVFWDVRNPERAVVVELAHEHYRKLIVEVADPDAAVRLIQGVATHHGS
jgi:hypothetical protein